MGKITDFLNELGNDPDAIARKLHQRGFKGYRGASNYCVLNAAIQLTFPKAIGLKIYTGHSPNHYYATFHDPQTMDPYISKPIQEFLKKFDDGCYPFLVAGPIDKVYSRQRREKVRYVF